MKRPSKEFSGVEIYEYPKNADERGSFNKVFESNVFPNNGTFAEFTSLAVSSNSKIGTIRGMHLQLKPYEEMKLITCLQGSVYDVFVDLRPGSQTFGDWGSVELSKVNRNVLFLPEGFAHGFQTTMDDTDILYAINGQYSKEYSRSILYSDEELSVGWPLPISSMSFGDKSAKSFSEIAREIQVL
jgi:dTDP-4-dehydrorhamnose 3,5-epimerase